MGRRAIFLDRDGVLNRKPSQHDYVKDFSEFYWNPRAKELVKSLKEENLLVVVITNQRGIALGKMSQEFVEKLHIKMNNDLAQVGASIDAFYVCPHGKENQCECRKPKPGMFLKAAEELGIDLSQSFMIGDRESDKLAATAAGCMQALVIPTDHLDVEYILNELKR